MHAETMHHAHAINRSNILSPYFIEFGYAVSVGDVGKLYSCQLFRSISPAAPLHSLSGELGNVEVVGSEILLPVSASARP
jgi:hypothetical protein